jgi:hypothetical protein
LKLEYFRVNNASSGKSDFFPQNSSTLDGPDFIRLNLVKGIDTKLSIEIIDISINDIRRLYIEKASIESGYSSMIY